MIKKLDPGRERRTINFLDSIRYSTVTDRSGSPLDLTLSLMVQNGNSEMRLASGRDDEVSTGRQPVILWFNGFGWRGEDKNMMAAEMEFLAEHGFAVAFVYYRGSGQGAWPAQMTDCRTAVRFLRAHADQYGLDPDHVGVIGRSAGGHLAAWMGLNLDFPDTDEWAGFSSQVQAAVDMFGPVDLPFLVRITQQHIKQPGFRWSTLGASHEGALLDLDDSMSDGEIQRICTAASPLYASKESACPMAILHGDQDPVVPLEVSERLYSSLVEAGLEDQTELYILKNGGHGTRELFQLSVKEVIADFFQRRLKG